MVGGPVLVDDLTDPDAGTAWPMFAGQAGVRPTSGSAFPLQLGAIRSRGARVVPRSSRRAAADRHERGVAGRRPPLLALLGQADSQDTGQDVSPQRSQFFKDLALAGAALMLFTFFAASPDLGLTVTGPLIQPGP